MNHTWRTAWHGQDILIYRDDDEVDSLHAPDIARVVFVYGGTGDSVGDLQYALVDTGDDILVLPAETGFGGRVNFERLDFWGERSCVYWVHQSQVKLPLRLRGGRWWSRGAPLFLRVPQADVAGLLDGWMLEGPQTWEQRKWRRIERKRPFSRIEEEERKRA